MTEADYLIIAQEFFNGLSSAFSLYFTLVSAFLIASYLVAHKLNNQMVIVLVSLYTLVIIWWGGSIYAQLDTMGSFSVKMQQAISKGLDLSWHFLAIPEQHNTLATLAMITTLAAYVGSIYFFFHARKQGRSDKKSD